MKKKKQLLKVFNLTMAAAMVSTPVLSNIYTVSAKEQTVDTTKKKTQKQVVYEDGVYDEWKGQNVQEGDSSKVEDGWLHIVSAPGDRNNPGTNPYMTVNPNTFDFTKEGYFEFTMKSNNENTNIDNSDRFGIYLGYNTDQNGMYIGYDNGGWFWQKYKDGNGDWYQGTREAAPKKGVEYKVRVEWTADHKMSFKLNDKVIFDNEDFSGIFASMGNQIAIKAGSWGNSGSNILLKDIHYPGQKEAEKVNVTGKILDAEGNAIKDALVKAGSESVKTDISGNFEVSLQPGTYMVSVSAQGYETYTDEITVGRDGLNLGEIKLTKAPELVTETLSTPYMDVSINKNFPSVQKYVMKEGDLKNKTFYGQTSNINTIRINGEDIKLSADDVQFTVNEGKTQATYKMHVYNNKLNKEERTIDADITAVLSVKDDALSFEITDVKNKLNEEYTDENGKHIYAIQSIEIPNHSLISVNSDQKGANLKGAAMSSNTTISGDEYIEVNDKTASGNRDYMYAFISNNEMSAGLWSNAENEGRAVSVGVSGGSHNTRVMATTEEKDGHVSLGLSSTKWYWHREEKDSKGEWHLVEETANPQAKITIAGNINGDNEIDWQDGAVAFRDIMHNPYKSEDVPELVSYRIAMNFGGQAQNPFLTTLDNVKRVAMHTDGLGQSVLLKGYGNEGHDSGHPDYADIGQRIGGEKDMNTLMEKGAEYGARFGIHVNAGEMYPEAKAFNEDLVRRDANGNLRYGWNWIDQGIGIDSVYDLGTGSREKRFDELEEKVGQNLDFVYVDIWGNQTGGSDDSWQTRKLSKEINDNGWRMATEWGSANEYDSTFQHWATDLTYGGYTLKGENSEVMRFLRNHQKDSWVGDYPNYGGAAIAPLLGGYNMKDFEGWQGRNDYDAYIKNIYTHDLTTKFIQHYEIVDWEDGKSFTATNPDGKPYTWTPEMKITLKDGKDTLVLERGSDDPNDPAYRDRTMTLNGKVISKGAVSRGDTGAKGTETYLLPWFWDAKTGDPVKSEDEKLYHWNTQGGTSEWDLPDSWKDLKDVKVYKLTDLGKTEEKTVPVKNGKITLEAESEVPYVVYKGEKGNLDITWSEGMHIVDAGFNSGHFDAWTKQGSGKAEIAKSQYSNPMMKLSGEVSMTQTLTDLTPGQQYAVLVGVDNRSDAKAKMTVKSGDKVLDSNYTTRSIAKNYVKAYTHSNASATVDGSSYFQHMYVYFTAPQSGDVTLTLSRDAGEGATYFDDVRIVENEAKNITKNADGEVVKFEQDFENNVQGIYPFVVSGSEGVEDNRIHLSELHAPYTQAGWDVKKMDDVLDGNWSVKVNGLTQKNNLIYQTIPQNFRFEPGKKYKVSFDYQTGSEGTYAVAVGNGEYNGNVALNELPMSMGENKDGHYTTEIIGDASGQTWFGIYSTNKAPDLQGTSGSAANFGGYKEIVLDNVVIEQVKETINESSLNDLIKEAESKYNKADYEPEVWNAFQKEIAKARVALDKDNVTQKDIEEAFYALRGAMVRMDKSAGVDASDDSRDIATDGMKATAGNEQATSGNEGPAKNVLDGDDGTIWHTSWGGTAQTNQWIDIALKEPTTVAGLRMLPRSSGNNGVITEAEIWVKTKDNKDYQKVKDAAFGTKGWQAIDFDAVEDVTNVKIQPTKTIGDAANKYASAAEIRLMSEKIDQPIVVDKSGLKAAIDDAKKLNEKDYTPDSWKVLEEKLEKAEVVMKDDNATDYDVLLATANLSEAIQALDPIKEPGPGEVDKTALNDLIKRADLIDTTRYTEESVNVFKKALAEAKEINADENATQEKVDSAKTSLEKAMNGLQLKEETNVDKTALMDKLSTALRLDSKYYTPESWKVLEDAIANAQKVIDNEKATQKEVNEAYAALDKAITSLVLKEQGTLPEQKPEKPSSGDKDSSIENKDDVKTGVESNTKGLLAFALLSGGAIISLLKKRRKLND